MKRLINTLAIILISLSFISCSSVFSISSDEKEKITYQTVLVTVENQDASFSKNIEYRTVREFQEQGVKAFANYNLSALSINKDTLDVCLFLSQVANARLVNISTGKLLWTGKVCLPENSIDASKEIASQLISDGIVAKTTYAKETGDKQVGAATWIFSALLVFFL